MNSQIDIALNELDRVIKVFSQKEFPEKIAKVFIKGVGKPMNKWSLGNQFLVFLQEMEIFSNCIWHRFSFTHWRRRYASCSFLAQFLFRNCRFHGWFRHCQPCVDCGRRLGRRSRNDFDSHHVQSHESLLDSCFGWRLWR